MWDNRKVSFQEDFVPNDDLTLRDGTSIIPGLRPFPSSAASSCSTMLSSWPSLLVKHDLLSDRIKGTK
jgi:hypothetical protein